MTKKSIRLEFTEEQKKRLRKQAYKAEKPLKTYLEEKVIKTLLPSQTKNNI